jgi:hypothetical protein
MSQAMQQLFETVIYNTGLQALLQLEEQLQVRSCELKIQLFGH